MVDPQRLSRVQGTIDDIAARIGADRIDDFSVSSIYGSYKVKWHPALEGLAAVRAVKAFMISQPLEGARGIPEHRVEVLEVLDGLEKVLDEADTREIRFCFVGNY